MKKGQKMRVWLLGAKGRPGRHGCAVTALIWEPRMKDLNGNHESTRISGLQCCDLTLSARSSLRSSRVSLLFTAVSHGQARDVRHGCAGP